MAIKEVFPFVEREDYALASWINDVVNLIKQRSFLLKKADAWLAFQENSADFMSCYCDGYSPKEAWNEFEGIEE